MRMRELVVTAAVACALGWFGHSAFSDDPPAGGGMDAFEKLAQPGEQHARLKSLVGEWNVHGTFNFGGPPSESDGTSSYSMIMDGRYLRQEMKSTFMGGPFEGRGVIGYDNAKQKYVSFWIDNHGTGFMLGEGTETTPGKVWTFESKFPGPGGSTMTTKEVLTKVSDKELSYEMFMGGDKPAMTLKYTRK